MESLLVSIKPQREVSVSLWDLNLMRVLLLLIAFLLSWNVIRSHNFGRRGKKGKTSPQTVIPSPPSLPYIGAGLLLIRSGGDLLTFSTSMFSKYGRIWKTNFLGRNYVALADANMIQKILSHNSPHVHQPKDVGEFFPLERLRDGLFTSEGELWKRQRKVLSEAFSFSSLKSYVGLINQQAEILVTELASRPLDFQELINNATLKTISDIVFGPEIGSEPVERARFLELTKSMLQIISARTESLLQLIPIVWKFHPASRELVRKLLEMEKIVLKKLAIFRKRGIPKSNVEATSDIVNTPLKSMLQMMLGSGMSDHLIYVECVSMLFAGHDTGSKSLELLMLQLALNPDLQKKCHEEIDRVCKDDSSSFRISMDSLSELKYLEKCIKESIRIYPIAPLFTRELEISQKIDEDIELDPKTIVCVSTWALHRDPEYFPNPYKFDPERFSTENVKNMHPFAYLPFSAGKRNCIGWKLAMMEQKAFASWILRHYEVETNDKLEDLTFRFGVTINWNKKINLVFKPRKVTNSHV